MYYAQLNDENICFGISALSGVVEHPQMIEISEAQYSEGDLMGRKYLGEGTWGEKTNPEPEPILSSDEFIIGLLEGYHGQ